jgi:RNA polymerase sigma factor (sigma-70 family)
MSDLGGLTRDQRVRVSLTMWLADRIARTVARHSKKLGGDDLMQIARLALIESAVRFDEERPDANFERYAWKRIVGKMIRLLKKEYRHHGRVVARVLAALDMALEPGDQFAGTDEGDAAYIDERLDDFASILFLGLAVDAWRSEGEEGAVRHETYVQTLRKMHEGLASLEEADSRVLRRRWFDEIEWPELAAEMGVSRSGAQRREYAARQRLKRYLLSHQVTEMPEIPR